MLRLLSTLITLLVGLLCIFLAVANREEVIVSLDPLETTLSVPLFFVGLFGVLIGILAIGPSAGMRQILLKRKVKKGEKTIAKLEAQIENLKAEKDVVERTVRPDEIAFLDAQRADTPLGSTGQPTMIEGPAAGQGPKTAA